MRPAATTGQPLWCKFTIRSVPTPRRLSEVNKAGMALWAFCRECAHASLFDPAHLGARIRRKADVLEDVARHMKCDRCNSKNCVLIPTTRSMVSFTRRN